jgi:REP-associated tyrosine transposase
MVNDTLLIMARQLRIEYPGAVYHVTSRGNEKKAIFKGDMDRETLLETLTQVNKRYNWLCHAYCLMNNHYHLIVETPDGNLSAGMRQLNGVYTQAFNKRHKRVGHLFQGRYKAILIQKDSHLLEVCRYVVLNPVRAKVVEKPEMWKWSSYQATCGRAKPHSSLTTEWILGQFGTTRNLAEKAYRQFVKEGIKHKTIWNAVKAQSILGEEEFAITLMDYLSGKRNIAELPKSQRYVDRPNLDKMFSQNILQDITKRNKKILEAVERHGYKQRDVADYLGMHFTSISRILRQSGVMLTK